jgi:hypothetical protein
MKGIRFACALATTCVAVVALGTGGAVASPGHMSCQSGYCGWGANYMGPSLNEIVTGGSNYWTAEDVRKNSGGVVYIGFGPSGCHKTFSGFASTSWAPSDIGCGGYINPFGQYVSGATSYLLFESFA